jgi:sortase (surface protein transpeptidase)
VRGVRGAGTAALVAVLLVLGAGLAVVTAGAAPGAAAPTSTAAPAQPQATATAPAAQASATSATRLRIPSIGVDAAFAPMDVDRAGVLIPPATTDVVGWFVRGPHPGQPGPAIAAGHIDSYEGPGVFFRLHEVGVGAMVEVDTDGAPVRYQVVSVTTFPKTEFPTEQVYGPTPAPELRLITCGGQFDRGDRRYLSNVIVSAVLV